MSTWHVWGDYYHTKPERIGTAKLLTGDDKAAQHTAEAQGFDFEKRMRNGFEPWAAAYEAEKDDGLDFAFASYPVVRGWARVS
jgi:hypothetical protein